jgi:proline dehydrogenase
MLRWILIYLSGAEWARKFIQNNPLAQKMASRFVAGETLDQAIMAVKELNAGGIYATLDHLGENVNSRGGALQAADEILGIINRLKEENVASGVSIKLSQIGLVIDQVLCQKNLDRILEQAQKLRIFIRIDMEDSTLTDQTIQIFTNHRNRTDPELVGIAIQSYLYRSEIDVRNLLKKEAGIRLCKGAYKESPTVAFPKKMDVDRNFDQIAEMLLDQSKISESRISQDGIIPPLAALGTHDAKRITHAKNYAERIGLQKNGLEFQMLYGIREDLQNQLVVEGYPVRVYVPYGVEWYPYFVRRLAERPANLWFFLTNLFR